MDTSIPYEASGRTAQKSRTRAALVDSARSLIANGGTPTVEEAAAAAGISRTTAYRYFRNQRDLIREAVPFIDTPSLLTGAASNDPAERLDRVLDSYLRFTLDNETALRTALRLSLETTGDEPALLRQGRVVRWVVEALDPLKSTLGAGAIDRLAKAIRAAAGIEALVWLVDVARMERGDAVNLMKWSAQALLRAALRKE